MRMSDIFLKISLFFLLYSALNTETYGINVTEASLYEVSINGVNKPVKTYRQFDIPVHAVHTVLDARSACIKIKIKEKICSYQISPLSRELKGEVTGKELVFSVDKPEYLIIKINELAYLFLMIDNPLEDIRPNKEMHIRNVLDFGVDRTGRNLSTFLFQKAINETARKGEVLYIPEGVYVTGQLNLVKDAVIYLADGACIKASINADDFPDKALLYINHASNIKIIGYGTIDGSGYTGLRKNGGQGCHLIYMYECQNVEIDGPLLLDPCFWNVRAFKSKEVHLRNIKILNNRPYENWNNTDGIDFDSSIDCSVNNAILHCGDDNLVVKGLDSERVFNTENILFEKVVTLSNSAATKIGTETCVEYFKNIVFKNIDIVKCKRAMVINVYDSAYVKNIVFENINVEAFDYKGVEVPRIIDFEITDTSWRPCLGNCRIDGVKIRDIHIYPDVQKVCSQLLGKSEPYSIRGVSIENLRIGRHLVHRPEDMNLKINEYVFDCEIKP